MITVDLTKASFAELAKASISSLERRCKNEFNPMIREILQKELETIKTAVNTAKETK